jgi:hypothetical protein
MWHTHFLCSGILPFTHFCVECGCLSVAMRVSTDAGIVVGIQSNTEVLGPCRSRICLVF